MKTQINTRCIIVKCFYGINHMLVKDHYYLIRNDTFIMREIVRYCIDMMAYQILYKVQ